MNTKVLMVYPEIPTTYWSFEYAMDYTDKKALMPPLGLITVAAMLPENWDAKVVDLNISKLNINDIEESDIVFLSAMIVQKESFNHVVQVCNEYGTPVAVGGPYPTNNYKNIEGVDYFILNEGEITLPKFIEDYEAGNPQHVYWDDTKPDITLTPVPRFDLLDVNAYGTMALQNSRGCPFNCEFCDIIELFGRVPRYKRPDQFIQEMNAVVNSGYMGPLFIVDDNFIGNKRKVKELLREIVSWQKRNDYPFTFFTEASINLADDEELMDLMVDAGFNMVFVGIETPVTESLDNMNKQQNTRSDLHESVRKMQEKGLEVMAGFIVGFDDDPENIFDLQIDFIQESAIPLSMIGLMLALPNTQLYRRLEKEGRILKDSSGNNTHELDLNFVPVMDREILINGYKRIIKEIYTPRTYFERCMKLIERLPKRGLKSRPVLLRDMKPLFMSLFLQSFSWYGYHYVKFIVKTLIKNPQNFPAAVNLAVKGQHFFKITADILKADRFARLLKRALNDLEDIFNALPVNDESFSDEVIEQKGYKFIRTYKRKGSRLKRTIQRQVKEKMTEFESECLDLVSNFKEKININRNNRV